MSRLREKVMGRLPLRHVRRPKKGASASVKERLKRLRRQTTPGDAQTETALVVAHDYAPRRVEDVSGVPRADLPLLAFRACLDGLELLLVPNFGRAYAVTVRPEVAAVLTPELEGAARALVPIVGADGDLGPLRRLADVS